MRAYALLLLLGFVCGVSNGADCNLRAPIPSFVVVDYKGSCQNGYAHGQGVALVQFPAQTGKDIVRIEGEFSDGSAHGQALVTSQSGRFGFHGELNQWNRHNGLAFEPYFLGFEEKTFLGGAIVSSQYKAKAPVFDRPSPLQAAKATQQEYAPPVQQTPEQIRAEYDRLQAEQRTLQQEWNRKGAEDRQRWERAAQEERKKWAQQAEEERVIAAQRQRQYLEQQREWNAAGAQQQIEWNRQGEQDRRNWQRAAGAPYGSSSYGSSGSYDTSSYGSSGSYGSSSYGSSGSYGTSSYGSSGSYGTSSYGSSGSYGSSSYGSSGSYGSSSYGSFKSAGTVAPNLPTSSPPATVAVPAPSSQVYSSYSTSSAPANSWGSTQSVANSPPIQQPPLASFSGNASSRPTQQSQPQVPRPVAATTPAVNHQTSPQVTSVRPVHPQRSPQIVPAPSPSPIRQFVYDCNNLVSGSSLGRSWSQHEAVFVESCKQKFLAEGAAAGKKDQRLGWAENAAKAGEATGNAANTLLMFLPGGAAVGTVEKAAAAGIKAGLAATAKKKATETATSATADGFSIGKANKLLSREHEKLTEAQLKAEFPNASVQNERLLRNADGSKAVDPVTGTGRRPDHVVIQDGQVIKMVETTNQTVNKAPQMDKEERILNQGAVYVRDKETSQLLKVDKSSEVKRQP